MKQLVPTFLHIPKNAGTYVLHVNHFLNHQYQSRGTQSFDLLAIKRCLIKLNTGGQITAFIFDKNLLCNTTNNFELISSLDPSAYTSNLTDFTRLLLNKQIELFSLHIDPVQLGIKQDFIEIENLLKLIERKPLYYALVRDPLKRAYSIFNYLNNNESSHEPTHGNIVAQNFNDYLSSNQVEDSWIIRHLLSLQDEVELKECHFQEAAQIFSSFIVSDIKNVNQVLIDVFKKCYNLNYSLSDFETFDLPRNSTNYRKSLDTQTVLPHCLSAFKSRTEFDYQFYKLFA
jgi:hypothetical protein